MAALTFGPADYAAREADWRNGAVVYQVFVDRFAPSANLEAKRDLYAAPRTLHDWSETPQRGSFVPEKGLWSHELAFWGGDLRSTQAKLDYIQGLGVDVLYLNPIHLAYTNHKYDAQDYREISPELGTRDDLKALAADLERRGMRLVLDGVFNHMGRTAPRFQEALADPKSPWREWFVIDPAIQHGYRAWFNVANLPELNLENAELRNYLWGDRDSVVRGYLRDGVDGWRLDVAHDIGPRILADLTRNAHDEKPDSLIVGEIYAYPAGWFPSVDSMIQFHTRELLTSLARGVVGGPEFARAIETQVADVGLEPLLKSWILLDNHDSQRIATSVPDVAMRRMLQALQFTLPGSPQLYYGSELGMLGGDDPEQRAPMRWDLVNDTNDELAWTRKLLALRKASRGLRVGDYVRLETKQLLAFARLTDRAEDSVFVVANPGSRLAKEAFAVRDGKMIGYTAVRDELGGPGSLIKAGVLEVSMPPRSIRVYRPVVTRGPGYSPFKRIP